MTNKHTDLIFFILLLAFTIPIAGLACVGISLGITEKFNAPVIGAASGTIIAAVYIAVVICIIENTNKRSRL